MEKASDKTNALAGDFRKVKVFPSKISTETWRQSSQNDFQADKSLQPVHFHEGHAGGVVFAANNSGIIAGS